MICKDLTFGTDGRGDYALFIHYCHVEADGWGIDQDTQDVVPDEPTFFRLIDDDGTPMRQHGWIENGRIIQWG
jgi:hypothetical protein